MPHYDGLSKSGLLKAQVLDYLATKEWHYLKRIRKCSLVSGSLSLMVGFKVSKPKPGPVSLSSYGLQICM